MTSLSSATASSRHSDPFVTGSSHAIKQLHCALTDTPFRTQAPREVLDYFIVKSVQRDDTKMYKNNFGFLRLVLATLVIVSHSAEIIDGNRSRELLTTFGGRLTFGEIAVDGFFIISGYLILKSFQQSASTFSYLIKRVRRIYPGFLVAWLVCIFVVAPIGGINPSSFNVADYIKMGTTALTLNGPYMEAFPWLEAHALNGSMWTIVYEFKCYLYVIALFFIGLYNRPYLFAALTACLLISNEIHWPTYLGPLPRIVGGPELFIRLEGMFCVGGCFYLFRDQIPLRRDIALLAALTLTACVRFSIWEEAVFALLGGYLIFFVALEVKSEVLMRINSKDDISYGVYLYAWPIQICLASLFAIKSPWLLMAATIPVVYAVGFASWRLVEKPFVRVRQLSGTTGQQ